MSVTYPIEQDESVCLNKQLEFELGWEEVANGLAKIVIGYVVWGVVLVVAGLIVGMAAFEVFKGGRQTVLRPALLWQFWGGMGLLGFGSLFSWWTIITGKWKCLLYVPDRHLARWFLFFCFTCVLVGPAFNMLASVAFSQNPPQFKQGPLGFMDLRLSGTGYVIQLMGFIISLLQPLFFLLFLRAVASCMNARFLLMLINFYVAGWCGLMAALGYLQMGPLSTRPKVLLIYLAVLGLVGLVWGIAYFGLILAVRSSITMTLANMRAAKLEQLGRRRR